MRRLGPQDGPRPGSDLRCNSKNRALTPRGGSASVGSGGATVAPDDTTSSEPSRVCDPWMAQKDPCPGDYRDAAVAVNQGKTQRRGRPSCIGDTLWQWLLIFLHLWHLQPLLPLHLPAPLQQTHGGPPRSSSHSWQPKPPLEREPLSVARCIHSPRTWRDLPSHWHGISGIMVLDDVVHVLRANVILHQIDTGSHSCSLKNVINALARMLRDVDELRSRVPALYLGE